MEYHGEVAKDISLIRYSNGDEIIVNYSSRPYTYKGKTIPSKAYKFYKKKGMFGLF